MTPTIGFVEDDDDLNELVPRLLEAEGFEVRAWKRGEDALEPLSADPPDLLLLDVNLPGMSGWELLERLRDRGIDAPAIALTARAGPGVDRSAREALGLETVVAKPFRVDDVIEAIEMALEEPQAKG